MVFPGDTPRAVEVMTAVAAAAASSSPSPPTQRPLVLRGKPRSRHPISQIRAAWANHSLLRCVRIDGTSDGSALSLPASSSERTRGPAGDDGLERIRAKLMDHLREAVGRIELPAVPSGEAWRNQPAWTLVEEADGGSGHDHGHEVCYDSSFPAPAASDNPVSAEAVPGASMSPVPAATTAAVEELPWKLRTRKLSASCTGPQHQQQYPQPSPSALTPSPAPSPPAKPKSRLRSAAPERREAALRRQRPRFSVPLTKEEIDEDLYAFTGRRASRRPKKRPRLVQRQLDTLFPGLWLSEVTEDAYQVADPPPTSS